MAANVTIIGRTTRVRGRLTGAADLEVQGFVEGEIAVSGDVTIDAAGMVGAGVHGRRVVVRGAVKGDLVGEEAVLGALGWSPRPVDAPPLIYDVIDDAKGRLA